MGHYARKIKEKILSNTFFVLEEKTNIKINKITFPSSSQMKITFQDSFSNQQIQFIYYDEKSSFEQRKKTSKDKAAESGIFIDNPKINTNSFSVFIKIKELENPNENYFLFTYHQGKIKILKKIKKKKLHGWINNLKYLKFVFKTFLELKENQRLKLSFLQGQRQILWASAWNVIQKEKLFGYGFRSWQAFSKQIQHNDYAYLYRHQIDTDHYYIHNNFLDLWYGNGLLNLIVFVILLAAVMGYFIGVFFLQRQPLDTFQKHFLFVCFLLFVQLNVIGIFDITLFVTSPIGSYYWVILALLLPKELVINKKVFS